MRLSLGIVLFVVLSCFLYTVFGSISAFSRYQMKSKAAEARSNLKAISIAQESFFSDFGVYAKVPFSGFPPSKQVTAWELVECPAECSLSMGQACSSFECLGFRPLGEVSYRYACETTEDHSYFTCVAVGDLDGDKIYSMYVFGIAPQGSTKLVASLPKAQGLDIDCSMARPFELFNCTPDEY